MTRRQISEKEEVVINFLPYCVASSSLNFLSGRSIVSALVRSPAAGGSTERRRGLSRGNSLPKSFFREENKRKRKTRGRQIGRGGTGSDPLVERRGIADNPIEGGLEKKASGDAASGKLERRGSVAF